MSGFDALIFAWKFGVNPYRWVDTMSMARPHYAKKSGLSLDALADYLSLPLPKLSLDATDTKGRRLCEFTSEQRKALAVYNARDTDVTLELFKRLAPITTPREGKLIDLTTRMLVEPKLLLDRKKIEDSLAFAAARRDRKLAVLSTMLKHETIAETQKALSSPARTKEVLEALGIEVPMKPSPKTPGKMIPALAKTDAGMTTLLEHEEESARLVAECRLNVKSNLLENRGERMLAAQLPDKRMPIPLIYCGADNTWRWSGGMKLNMQNLPRVDSKHPKTTDALRRSLIAPEGYQVVAIDLSGIEMRVNHFIWKQEETMSAYGEDAKADLYILDAAAEHGVPPEDVTSEQRRFAKTKMLALGYQTGAKKFQDQARLAGIDLTLEEARQAVQAWRSRYYRIAEGWARCEAALEAMTLPNQQARDGYLDPLGFYRIERESLVFTPRGTRLLYPKLQKQKRANSSFSDWVFCDRDHKTGKTYWEKVFGGKICENIVSHLSRHVLTDAMLAFADTELGRRYLPVHCVHDELVYVVRKEDAEQVYNAVRQLLITPPSWWPELVVNAEGGVGCSYADAK